MATYKVIQDIEAEDKLVGPLTLRQFIYAAVMVACLYICFIGITKNAALIIVPIFLPPALVAGFFAFPWKGEQPTEIWALAKIRFMIKPRKRVWDQSGVKELVTITAPKKIERDYTNGLSQTEVKSRLRALADTIDSRGWAVKNVDPNNLNPSIPVMQPNSDRLVGVSVAPPQDNGSDVHAEDDMLDEQNNPVAQQFEAMMTRAAQDHRQQVMQAMTQAQQRPQPSAQPTQDNTHTQSRTTLPPVVHQSNTPQQTPTNNYWFMSQQPAAGNPATQVIAPGMTEDSVPPAAAAAEPTADDKALAKQLREQNNTQAVSYAHLHTIQPLSVQQAQAKAHTAAAAEVAARAAETQKTTAPSMTAQPDPAIIALASNNDLNVATIARQANQEKQESADEVVIPLH